MEAGSKSIGVSTATEKAKVYASDVTFRNDIIDLVSLRSLSSPQRTVKCNTASQVQQLDILQRKKVKSLLICSGISIRV